MSFWTTDLSKGACQDHLGTRGKQLGSGYLILITCCETVGDYLSSSDVVKLQAVNSGESKFGFVLVRVSGSPE